MLTTLKTKTVATKNVVVKHRAKIAVAVTIATMAALQFRNARELNEFLKAHGLLEEYYAQGITEELEALNAA